MTRSPASVASDARVAAGRADLSGRVGTRVVYRLTRLELRPLGYLPKLKRLEDAGLREARSAAASAGRRYLMEEVRITIGSRGTIFASQTIRPTNIPSYGDRLGRAVRVIQEAYNVGYIQQLFYQLVSQIRVTLIWQIRR